MKWAEVWRLRSALVYTVGSWVVFGSVLYYVSKHTKKREKEPPPPTTGLFVSEDGLKEILAYIPEGRGFNVISTTLYKTNFVPRSNNYVEESFLHDSGDKGK